VVKVSERWDLAPRRLRAGRHYPGTWQEFIAWFSTDERCHDFLADLRWSDGFVCPLCEEGSGHRTGMRWWCPKCRHWSSVTTRTSLQQTHLTLQTWLLAVWLMSSDKRGVSATFLSSSLGIDYRSAWHVLHKVRLTFSQEDREPLKGLVEIDEMYLGGQDLGNNRRGRSLATKACVVIACECKRGKVIGRIRMGRLEDSTHTSLEPWIQRHVEKGSAIHTDGHRGYINLKSLGYKHKATSMTQSPYPAHVVFPRVHTIASLSKRWILGTHHGGIHPQYLDPYLDEFVFRFNRRHSWSRGLVFYRVLQGLLERDAYVTRPQVHRVPLPKPSTTGTQATGAPKTSKRKQDAVNQQLVEDELFDWAELEDAEGPPTPFCPLPEDSSSELLHGEAPRLIAQGR
jgi:transposase-like protein